MKCSDKERRTAHHEAGHAVADERFGFSCDSVHMIQDGNVLGASGAIDGPSIDGSEDFLAVVALLAGYAAEVVCMGGSTPETERGASSDMERARDLLDRSGNDDLFDEALSTALSFAAGDEQAIRLVAHDLLARRRLVWEEVSTLIEIADKRVNGEDVVQLAQELAQMRAVFIDA